MFIYELPLLYGKHIGRDYQLLFDDASKARLAFPVGKITIQNLYK
jgi:hypothetical protein